jgi:hypothetical protein
MREETIPLLFVFVMGNIIYGFLAPEEFFRSFSFT